MTCDVVREMLGAYLDGELDANTGLQLRTHLAECSDCAAAENRLRAMKSAIRTSAGLRYPAPAGLEARIRGSLGDRPRAKRPPALRTWMAMAASILVVSAIALSFYPARNHAAAADQLADQAVSNHIRAMFTGHSIDVASTDQHTVKPWFSGKLDFSPPVKDLAAAGFPLTGARVDYLDHKEVAALVYRRNKHVIDLFIWPAAGAQPAVKSLSGFNIVTWTGGGMSFSAVSDLNTAELEQFAELLRK